MFDTIAEKHTRDKDLPERAWWIGVLRAVLDGSFYDVLRHPFHREKTDAGEYVPLRDRRPSVRYNLCRIVAEDAATLVFGEERFPRVTCDDVAVAAALNELAEETALATVMTEAAVCGSVGSVVVLLRVLKGRVFWSVMGTAFLTPEWQPDAPDTLKSVTEQYKVRGSALRERGYAIADKDLSRWFWFRRMWDCSAELWYLPWPVTAEPNETAGPVVDDARSVQHGLGFVPMVWIRNLPGPSATGAPCDGACTFKPAIDTQIEIEYQLSQAGRGLKYSSDPTLVVKEPAAADEQFVKGAGNALVVSDKGDAKLLEIGGTAAAAVVEYVRFLRESALESMHGNRSDPNRFSAAQSGRALEVMNHGLIGLAGQVRTSYGNQALKRMLRMVLDAAGTFDITCGGKPFPRTPPGRLGLIWQDWYPPSAEERRAESQTLQILTQSGVMSRETAVGITADVYDVPDHRAELARIAADQKAEDERLARQNAQTKAAEAVPA
jgi:hypothetical protein